MSTYNVGDRVLVVDIHSAFYAEEGVVKSKSKDTISVSLDVGPLLSRSTKRGSDFQKITTGTIKPVVQCSAQIANIESDPVNHPSHYGGDTTYEAIKVITAWGLGFDLGNVTKYVARAGKKDPSKELEDLRKARFYLEHRIKQLEQNK